MIETLTAEGLPVAEALRSVGMREAEYDRWRVEYSGLEANAGSAVGRRAEACEEDAPRRLPRRCASRLCNLLVKRG